MFAKQVESLRRLAIERVLYYEIAYEGGTPERTRYGAIFDSLDFGLELQTVDGQSFYIVWDGRCCQYGLTLELGSLANELGTFAVWDVTGASRWQHVLYQPITAVNIYWLRVEEDSDKIWCPDTIELIFESGQRVFLVAAQYFREHDYLFVLSDELVVIFDEAVAQRYQIGPFANGPWRGVGSAAPSTSGK